MRSHLYNAEGGVDSIRYYVALTILLFLPPVILYWFSIHPLIRFWRKVGLHLTLGIHYAAMLLLAGLISVAGRPLLTVEFGTSPTLIGLALLPALFSLILRKRLSRHLRPGIFMGIPEISPEKHKIRLLTEGIYGRLRHPRYVQLFLGVVAYALFCNYLTIYILLPALAIILYLLVQIEERELRNRFGAEYDAYCARVPRFIPEFRPQSLAGRIGGSTLDIKTGQGRRP
jgi:protein-S-isoprenylcysteine O-methyltransferase Ste14